MAEAAGLVVGVVALSGLFNNTVQCFEYIQLGRAFGKDYQTSQLKLDSARLRLSRWGKSLNLDADDLKNSTSLEEQFKSNADVDHAQNLLGQIQDLFADAEGISTKYKSRANPGDNNLAIYDPKKDLEPPIVKLHEQMHNLALARQNETGRRQKAKWALYQQKSFARLIEDVTELVDNLVDLFPAAQPAQIELCEQEVATFDDNESLALLKEISATQDRQLEDAIANAANKSGAIYNNTFSGTFTRSAATAHNSGSMVNNFGDTVQGERKP
ncbi:hypothetical protein NX059_004536 [Plenodomus lindquistii]|nr:hypothetical protein NX059_004536 [Plenodomus lindquistii]